ncbi:hypothetical protein I4F81_005303 [Pyropia yezoensis]|uniref:Uncharacterized protein n=1 Tax=Pyropia yezoensis TaxID=2788 RepID=A0ACC3BYG0_PYRYE|nr:hypothetical protein I4F81_005303 [Neopyropia yezoensis]
MAGPPPPPPAAAVAAVATPASWRPPPRPAGVALGFATPTVPWPSAAAAGRAVVRGRPPLAGRAVATAASRRAVAGVAASPPSKSLEAVGVSMRFFGRGGSSSSRAAAEAAAAAAAVAGASTLGASAATAPTPGPFPAGVPDASGGVRARRVAIVVEPTPFTHVSGYANRYKGLVEHLRSRGDEVLVITPDSSADAPTSYAGATVASIRGFRFPLYPAIRLSIGGPKVYRLLRDFAPDVIHLTTPGTLVFAVLAFARILRVPLVASYHTHLPVYAARYGLTPLVGLAWLLIRLCHNRADLTLATSPQLVDELSAHGVQRATLWPKGVDTDLFHPRCATAAMRSRLSDGHPEAPLLLYVGRIGAEKNLAFLRGVLERLPAARLAIVGDGPARGAVEKALAGTATVFTGILTGADLSAAYASADVFVMPSESETLGFVVLEAAAAGVPAVAAAAGGLRDVVKDGVTGFLFPAAGPSPSAAAVEASTDAAVAHIARLVSSPDLCRRVGDAARAEACRWSWDASNAATRDGHYLRAAFNFRTRALGGLGLPRSLSWLRWIRRRIAAIRMRFRRAFFTFA